jgi:hypothetical protein
VQLPRRRSVPADVKQALPLARGERIGAASRDADERWYVGTSAALFVPDGSSYRRIPWENIERAEWQQESERLLVEEVAEFGQPQRRTDAQLLDGQTLLQLVRERVTASVVLTRFTPVRGRRGISVIGRRAPGSNGPVDWSVQFDPEVSPEDPLARAAAEQALAEAQRELG